MLCVLVIALHGLTLWMAPFTSLYPTLPAVLILIAFLAIFLLCTKFVIIRFGRHFEREPALPCLLEKALRDRRLRAFLLLVSLGGAALHVGSKIYLLELRPITCISEIRFVWLEVDRSLLPVYIRAASILGHLLTSFAYLGMLSTSYTISQSRSVSAIGRNDVLLQLLFTLIGAVYAGFIGSKNAMLAFLVMNAIGTMLGMASTGSGLIRQWRIATVTLAVPLVAMIAFSSAIFSDRLFCHAPSELSQLEGPGLSQPEGPGLSAGRIAAYHMTGNFREFDLKARSLEDGGRWREALVTDICPVCGPMMVYANHGIFNLSKVFAYEERGDPILFGHIKSWARRIGVDFAATDGGVMKRVYGPGGITLAGAAFHDFGFLGSLAVAAILGTAFGFAILWMQSTGIRSLAGLWLFSSLFYVLLISSLFVGYSVLPFPFVTFGVGAGLLVWVLMNASSPAYFPHG
jgi:hypothetical protein